jgi:hypothetical protein
MHRMEKANWRWEDGVGRKCWGWWVPRRGRAGALNEGNLTFPRREANLLDVVPGLGCSGVALHHGAD